MKKLIISCLMITLSFAIIAYNPKTSFAETADRNFEDIMRDGRINAKKVEVMMKKQVEDFLLRSANRPMSIEERQNQNLFKPIDNKYLRLMGLADRNNITSKNEAMRVYQEINDMIANLNDKGINYRPIYFRDPNIANKLIEKMADIDLSEITQDMEKAMKMAEEKRQEIMRENSNSKEFYSPRMQNISNPYSSSTR